MFQIHYNKEKIYLEIEEMKLKKSMASLVLALILIASSFTAQAVDVVQIPDEDVETVYNQSVQSNHVENWPRGPQIYSEAGIVMDIDSGAILYAKNIDSPHYPASITKVLTALVAMENNKLTDTITVKQEDIAILTPGDSHIALKVGEEISYEDGLYAALLASANEAAHSLASNTEGGYDAFLEKMNAKAAELGCTNSHFTNTHGLHEAEHYTTARDMALIGAAAFKNEDFMKITGTLQYKIEPTNLTDVERYVAQNHKMLYDWRSEYYEYCLGGKTGYTLEALNTLITFSSKDGVNLVAVVLRAHGKGKTFIDTRAMLDYAYENFNKVPVSEDMLNDANVEKVNKNAYVLLPVGVNYEDLTYTLQEPTKKGSRKGVAKLQYGDMVVGEFDVTITEERHNEIHGITEKKATEKKKKNTPWIGIIGTFILIVLFVTIALLMVLMFYGMYRRKQRRLQRAEMRRKRREAEYRKHLEEMDFDEE